MFQRYHTGGVAAALLLALGELGGAGAVSAQSTSTAGLRGRILDTEGAPVEAALVTLTHTGTGATSTVLSVADGRYTLRGQRPGGPYRITVTHIGFQDFTREDIVLLLGRFADLDITLVSEAIDLEELVVEVEQDLVFNPGRIGIATLVTSETLSELPTLTRNFVDFAALSPLSRVSEEGVSVAGGNYRFNTLNVDGALNQDVFGLSTNAVAGGRAGARVIPLEAVEQFQLEVAPFDIRQSGFTGGALNAVTKSGTNEFETSAFGFFRGSGLVGELVVDDISTVPELSTSRAGFTAGGPIRRNRAHFFVAGEWERVTEPPTGFHVGESDPFRLSLLPDSVAWMRSLLEDYGVDPGTASSFGLENRLANLFARIDWEMGERHDAMFRYSFSAANDDPDPNRLPGEAYELSSNGTRIRSRSHSAVFQLVSSLGNRLSNELSANVQFLRDDETPMSIFPEVEVRVEGEAEGFHLRRDVRAGARFFAQNNGLDQRIIQLSNNLSHDVGNHQLLFGASGTWFSFDRRFVPGQLGSYAFNSLEEFALNRPVRYEVTIPQTDQGELQSFQVSELAFYAQDEWEAHERLTLRAGLRMDVPAFAGRPEPNPELHRELAIHHWELPDAGMTWSARAGLNWRPFDGTQIRIGTGLFTGRPAFAWLANAFQNNGLALTTLVCRDDRAPAFDPSRGFGTRDVWGSVPVHNYEQLWLGGRLHDRFGPILRVGNRDGNLAYAATIELRKDFGSALELRAGYSLTRSADLQDLLTIDVTSNYGTTPINFNPNEPVPQRSRFDRPHKVVASAQTRIMPRFGGTGISILYVGQSGAPYSYVYDGDVNGDGFPGPRASGLANDLIYIPGLALHLPASLVTQGLWEGLFEEEECLREQAWRILARNTCEAPWSHRLDLRLLQTIETRGWSADITLDMINVLNLMNSSWGLVHVAQPVVRLFQVGRYPKDRRPGREQPDPDPDLYIWYTGATARDRETGRPRGTLPLAPEVPTSQWRAQLGLRVSVGG